MSNSSDANLLLDWAVPAQRKTEKVTASKKIDYLSPDVPDELPWLDVPLVRATNENLQGYGQLVDDYHDFPVEIVTWPAPGWRPVDPGTGNEAG